MKSGLPSAVSASRAAASLLRLWSRRPAELLRVLGAQRGQRQCAVRRQPSAPGRRESSSSGRLSVRQHDRQVAQPRGQQLDQVEQAAIGPVDVLEDEQRRPVARDGLDEDAHREEELLAVVDGAFGVEPEQDREVAATVSHRPGAVGDVLASFASADLGRSLSKIPQSCLTWIAKREVRAALAVRSERPWTVRPPSSSTSPRTPAQARLADPGRAEHGDEVRDATRRRPLPDPAQHLQLARAADELARVLPLPCGALRPHRDPRLDRLRLALRLDRLVGLVLDRVLVAA
jgi:hypothetical protein